MSWPVISWTQWAEQECGAIQTAGRWRTVRDLDGPGPVSVLDGGEERLVVSFEIGRAHV